MAVATALGHQQQLDFQHFALWEDQRLLVGRRSQMPLAGQPAQKLFDLGPTYFVRIPDSADVDFDGVFCRQRCGQPRRPQSGARMKCDNRHEIRSRLAADWWKPVLARRLRLSHSHPATGAAFVGRKMLDEFTVNG
jgi:hypothetical protein